MNIRLISIIFFLILFSLSVDNEIVADKRDSGGREQDFINARTGIRMHSESIRIIVLNKTAVTSVDFYYTGYASVKREIAFPETEWFSLDYFQSYYNGRRMNPEKVKSPPGNPFVINRDFYPAVFSYTVPASGQYANQSQVLYSYKMPCHKASSKKEYPSLPDQYTGLYIEYILRTGAPWDKSIHSIDAEIHLPDGHCSDLVHLPGSYVGKCVSDRRWVLRLENAEPEKNIRLVLKNAC